MLTLSTIICNSSLTQTTAKRVACFDNDYLENAQKAQNFPNGILVVVILDETNAIYIGRCFAILADMVLTDLATTNVVYHLNTT
ncbi:hypothetical protein BLOT_007573, partial [Blomia tropicalis]